MEHFTTDKVLLSCDTVVMMSFLKGQKMLLIVVFLSNLLYAQSSSPILDPEKFTICAATINSDNERKIFEEQIKKNPNAFNPVVELTSFGDESDWFSEACKSGIRCDQLIISGHFGGSFFGTSGKELGLDLIEEKGCAKTCEGILSHPYEVFLFGCNTLADKTLDSRTPDQYLQVLLSDNIPRDQALMIVESRYGLTVEANRTRMSRAFTGAQKQLYGFSSIGPSGKNVEGFLTDYFAKSNLGERLEKLQAARLISKVDFTNKSLAESLKLTAFAQCSAGTQEGTPVKDDVICPLRDPANSIDKKIEIVIEAFAQPDYLIYVKVISDFFNSNPLENMTTDQREKLRVLSANNTLKSQFLLFMDKTTDIQLYAAWISLAGNLGFISKREEDVLISGRVTKAFVQGLGVSQKDAICSLPDEVKDRIKLNPLAILPLKFKPMDYVGLSCLAPRDLNLQKKLVLGLKLSDVNARRSVTEALIKVLPNDYGIQLQLLEHLNEKDQEVLSNILTAFAAVKTLHKEIQLKLLERASGKVDDDFRLNLISSVTEHQIQDLSVQLKLLSFRKDKDDALRAAVFEAFIGVPRLDDSVKLRLLDGLSDSEDSISYKATDIVKKLKPYSKMVTQKIIQGLNGPNQACYFSKEILNSIDKKDAEVVRALKTAKSCVERE